MLNLRLFGDRCRQPPHQTTGDPAILDQKQFLPRLQAGEELGDAGREIIEIEAFHNGENLPRLRT